MRNRKVLLINGAGFMGGDVAMLLLGLPFLQQKHYSLSIVSIPRGEVYEELRKIPGVQMITMELGGTELPPSTNFGKLGRAAAIAAAAVRIAAFVRREKIDAIYALDRTVATLLSYLVAHLTGTPLILSAHISYYLDTSALMRRVVRHAKAVTVTSEHMGKRFLPYVSDPTRIFKILNAIKLELYDATLPGTPIRQELTIAPETPVVILAGRLSPFKGQDDLIRAAAIIRQERPDVQFLLAGAENVAGFTKVLTQLIAEQQLENTVRLIGYRKDLPAVFAAATICTMPSHEEPFGLVALEAMAMGKPVVATRAGGVPEFLVDGEMGFLIEPRDHQALARAILKLVNEPALAQAMGRRGRQHVEEYFTANVYGRNIVATFDTVFR